MDFFSADFRLKTVEVFYRDLNRNEVKSLLTMVTPDILRVEFENTPSAGTFRGHEEFEAHVTSGRSTWAEGGCLPEKMIIDGDHILVTVHVRVRLRDREEWIDGHTADVFTFTGAKISEFRTFFRPEEAEAFISATRRS